MLITAPCRHDVNYNIRTCPLPALMHLALCIYMCSNLDLYMLKWIYTCWIYTCLNCGLPCPHQKDNTSQRYVFKLL